MKPRVLILVALLAGTVLTVPAVAQEEDGEGIYEQTCSSCHQPGGVGIPGAFPPLAGNPNAADTDYVAATIRDGLSGPLTVNGETFDGVMPPVSSLSDAQIAAVTEYVAGLAQGEAQPPDTTPIAPPTGGDSNAGEALFLGSESFANRAPACGACHAVGSHDLLGGPGLGPDLTDVFLRFGGEAGVAAALATPPSATMTPLFVDHPLTEGEIADLTAYLGEVSNETASTGMDWFSLYGLVGLVVLLAFLAIFVRKPQATYVEKLRGGTR